MMKKTIAIIVKTAQGKWTARSENHKLWEEARPDLVARKKVANARSWRNTSKADPTPSKATVRGGPTARAHQKEEHREEGRNNGRRE